MESDAGSAMCVVRIKRCLANRQIEPLKTRKYSLDRTISQTDTQVVLNLIRVAVHAACFVPWDGSSG
ncbi:MAG TPA: hypothetical protein DCG12_14110 [Planctomycetaceae bacterium]|nr:hypothetical protein [Planctomycetaceae bacterium]